MIIINTNFVCILLILFMCEYTYKYGPTFSYGDDGRGYQKNLKKKSAKLQFVFLKKTIARERTCKLVRVQQYCVSVIQYVVRIIF